MLHIFFLIMYVGINCIWELNDTMSDFFFLSCSEHSVKSFVYLNSKAENEKLPRFGGFSGVLVI